ncbi:hypothetical protein KXS11_06655 [Plantibacter flavus]|uniref:hypothetical protein n=1 Tax=Plantibacter flavus TaxID=150123 RepID=UPI003F16CAB4
MTTATTGSTATATDPRSVLVRGFRRAAVITIIVSLSLTALLGIVVLFTGDFGEVQGRILLTALLVAGFSITALCDLALAGRALRFVAVIGVCVALVALVLGVIVIWHDWSGGGFGDVLRWFAISGIWALSLAQANLLLLLAHRRHLVIQAGLLATIVFIAIVAILLSLPILTNGEIPGAVADDYWRGFGVAVILDALGTIVVPVLSVFLRDEPAGGAVEEDGGSWIQLPVDLAARVEQTAIRAGATPEQVVAFAVRAHLDAEASRLSPRGPDDATAAR